MAGSDEVWAVLGTVINPTFGLSLVALEMVKAVRVNGDAVTVGLLLDCPGCPGAEAALAQGSRKLRALNPAPGQVTVSLAPEKWSPPWEGYWFTSGIAWMDGSTGENNDIGHIGYDRRIGSRAPGRRPAGRA